MRKSHFTETQIIGVIKEQEAAQPKSGLFSPTRQDFYWQENVKVKVEPCRPDQGGKCDGS
ncbi:MAG: hypothetical protein QM645_13975 [Asticcacaulis sp.]